MFSAYRFVESMLEIGICHVSLNRSTNVHQGGPSTTLIREPSEYNRPTRNRIGGITVGDKECCQKIKRVNKLLRVNVDDNYTYIPISKK